MGHRTSVCVCILVIGISMTFSLFSHGFKYHENNVISFEKYAEKKTLLNDNLFLR